MKAKPKLPKRSINLPIFEGVAKLLHTEADMDAVLLIVFPRGSDKAEVAAALEPEANEDLPARLRKLADSWEKGTGIRIAPDKPL